MIKIYHPRKKKEVEVKGLAVKGNKTFNDDGEAIEQEYVEFTVIGQNTEYQDFLLIDDFESNNPTIEISK